MNPPQVYKTSTQKKILLKDIKNLIKGCTISIFNAIPNKIIVVCVHLCVTTNTQVFIKCNRPKTNKHKEGKTGGFTPPTIRAY